MLGVRETAASRRGHDTCNKAAQMRSIDCTSYGEQGQPVTLGSMLAQRCEQAHMLLYGTDMGACHCNRDNVDLL